MTHQWNQEETPGPSSQGHVRQTDCDSCICLLSVTSWSVGPALRSAEESLLQLQPGGDTVCVIFLHQTIFTTHLLSC